MMYYVLTESKDREGQPLLLVLPCPPPTPLGLRLPSSALHMQRSQAVLQPRSLSQLWGGSIHQSRASISLEMWMPFSRSWFQRCLWHFYLN